MKASSGGKKGSKIKEKDGNEKGVVRVKGRWSVNVKEPNIICGCRVGRSEGCVKTETERKRNADGDTETLGPTVAAAAAAVCVCVLICMSVCVCVCVCVFEAVPV